MLPLLPGAEPTPDAATTSSDIRIQIAWGGKQARLWQGSMTISDGTFTDLKTLGMDTDQPGSQRTEQDRVTISPRLPHKYDGFEISCRGTSSAKIRIELTPDEDTAATRVFEIPLAELYDTGPSFPLDDIGNRLGITRAPGDEVRILFDRDHLVFSPGETWTLRIQPGQLAVKPGTPLKARVKVKSADPQEKKRLDVVGLWSENRPLWSQEVELAWNGTSYLPSSALHVEIPDEEGTYWLEVEIVPRRALNGLFPANSLIHASSPIVGRTAQFVVLHDLPIPWNSEGPQERQGELVTEFNAAEPHSFERLVQLPQWNLLPRNRRGPWSNQEPEVWKDQNRVWTRIGQQGWIAYSLPIGEVDLPHVLQVELPAHLPQNVGVCILEPNAAGELVSSGLDSGVSVADPNLHFIRTDEGDVIHHRLVFWPRTTSPTLLITNRQTSGTVSFGRIRLEVFRQGLPEHRPADESLDERANTSEVPTRQRMAYLDRPSLNRIFLAPEAIDTKKPYSLEDWRTFYTSAHRLAEYLKYAGYDGICMTIAAEGSGLYPSRLLEPTPFYDRGVFFSSGQDLRRKDVVELLCRVLTQHELMFIPAIEFATPLPELELHLSRPDLADENIRLLDRNGLSWAQRFGGTSGRGPHYNPLDRRVQEAIARVLLEMTDRYGKHPAYGGLQVNFVSDGYTHFPGPEWGMDIHTLSEFKHQASLPQGSLEFPKSTTLSPAQQSAWLSWRAQQLTEFYERLSKTIYERTKRPLYLGLHDLANGTTWGRHLRASLPRQSSIEAAFLDVGLSPEILIQPTESLVVLRPHRIQPFTSIGAQAINLELDQRSDVQQLFATTTASIFHREGDPLSLPSFGEKGPFPRARLVLHTQFERGGVQARRHLAESLAAEDAVTWFDGGRSLSFGQESSILPFADVYHRLPAERFATLPFTSARPITARRWEGKTDTWFYLVNDSPWRTEVELEFQGVTPDQLRAFGSSWTGDEVIVEPYGLVAFHAAVPGVQLTTCRTELPAEVAKEISIQFDEVVARQERIAPTEPLTLLNDPDFEVPFAQAPYPTWTVTTQGKASARLDSTVKASGNSSLKLRNEGGTVVVTSETFQPPATGRIYVSMQLRSQTNRPRRFLLRLESNDEEYHPFHVFDADELGPKFQEIPIRDIEVPMDPNLKMRISFELLDEGEIWIDDLRIYDKRFEQGEQNALRKILQRASTQKQEGNLAGCYQTLNGYWPRFLLHHVPALEPNPSALATQTVAKPDSGLPTSVPGVQAGKSSTKTQRSESTSESRGMFDPIKRWWPKLRF